MGRTAPRRPGPLPRGGSPAVHGVHHPPRDVHFPERAQHALTAVWPAGQADDEDLEEAGEVGARSGCQGGEALLSPDPRPAGWGHSPHRIPSWWDSLGAGTHEPRPTWGAHPLWRKAPPTVSP